MRLITPFCLSLVVGMLALGVHAKTLRWSSQGDVQTMDPHAYNEALNNSVMDHIYEPLVTYDKKMVVEPALAVSWQQVNDTTMRFKLRPNVRFHDGKPFTADDVVFTIERVMSPTSNMKVNVDGVVRAVKVDDLTVDVLTNGPAPVLLRQLTGVRIMSKAWCQQNNVLVPLDFKNKQETYAHRNTNGTGPFMLKSREADVKTVLVVNPAWWKKHETNVTEIVYLPIKSENTRMAALFSGEVDFVLDPPVQDIPRIRQNPALKVVEGNEIRTIYLSMDQYRDELLYSSVKGKNPLKDVRVRQAFYHAIDSEAIKTQVMRGLALPTGSMITPEVHGFTKETDRRPAFDTKRAKQLLADAGYPNGFDITLDCPNNRYINDEKICVALAAMLSKIDVKVKVNAMPRTTFFPKIQNRDTSFYLMGWGVITVDAHNTLQTQVRTPGQGADGEWNFGKYSNPKVDALIDKLKTEMDQGKRVELTTEILSIHNAEVGHIPLHHQIIPWAMKSNIDVVHSPQNALRVKWVNIK
jgi:peptide/nickel transport system substrate-binding protein